MFQNLTYDIRELPWPAKHGKFYRYILRLVFDKSHQIEISTTKI